MVYKIEGQKIKVFPKLYKSKVHKKGLVFLPAEVKKAVGIEEGSPISIEVIDKKIIIRPIEPPREVVDEISEEELQSLRVDAWLFRGAYGDALEFLRKLSRTLREIYGREFEVGEERTLNKVYLKLEEGNLQDGIHFAYFENLNYREGVITLDFGRGEEAQRLIEEFQALLPEEVRSRLKQIGKNEVGIGLKVIQYPKFSEEELGMLTYLASKVLEHILLRKVSNQIQP
ncbi:AbrB/MazE/SpoVT family DNA-binding domain-containing protein [Aquifex sp.]